MPKLRLSKYKCSGAGKSPVVWAAGVSIPAVAVSATKLSSGAVSADTISTIAVSADTVSTGAASADTVSAIAAWPGTVSAGTGVSVPDGAVRSRLSAAGVSAICDGAAGEAKEK